MLNDDGRGAGGGGGAVDAAGGGGGGGRGRGRGGEGDGGLAREGNGKGFIDLGVVEARKGVEEVLVMFVRDCEFARNKIKKSIFPLLNLTFFLSIFDGCILGRRGRERFKGVVFRHTALF